MMRHVGRGSAGIAHASSDSSPDSGNAACCGRRHVIVNAPLKPIRAELGRRMPVDSGNSMQDGSTA